MVSHDVVTACKTLFGARSFLAAGIVSVLRTEDVKIALAKKLHERKARADGAKESSNIDLLLCYDTLVHYIAENNLEVILSLEYFADAAANGSTYLYPIPGKSNSGQSPQQKLSTQKSVFFKGQLPMRKLRFGTYLYYRGIISYYMLMESLAWQKNRRPLLGQIAMQIGHLSPENFARIVVYVKQGDCFGTVARRYGILNDNVIDAIVKSQEKYECRIGGYFIEKGTLSSEETGTLHDEMTRHNQRFG